MKITHIARAITFGTLFVASTALAQGPGPQSGMMGGHPPGVFGKVTAINGTTLTVEPRNPAPTENAPGSYSVDASHATVVKEQTNLTVGDVKVGDEVMVLGTIDGANVTANVIREGMPQGRPDGHGAGPWKPTDLITPNGKPVVGGTITNIDGSTVTITNASDQTFTVDAGSAVVVKDHATSSVSALAVGDKIVIQGDVNGNTITASSIVESNMPQGRGHGDAQGANAGQGGGGFFHRFFGGIGGFFHRFFGFF